MVEVGIPTALEEVRQERVRQDEKWGEQNHPDGTGPHYGHYWADTALARGITEGAAKRGYLTWAQILEEEVAEALFETHPRTLREELIQVAAVAVAWVEALDRRQEAA